MPNIENITRVQEAIKAQEIASFNMQKWINEECGTKACIGGFAELLMKQDSGQSADFAVEDVREFLGISYDTSADLFFGYNSSYPLENITVPMSIAALEDLKKDQFVRWDDYIHIREENKS